jgi:hypothetical protein
VDSASIALRFRICTFKAAECQDRICHPPPPSYYFCTKSYQPMIQAHCSDAADAAQLWRMLCHVPDADFQPIDVHVAGQLAYRVIRTEAGDQSTVQPAAAQG